MGKKRTVEHASEFGAAWNTRDLDFIMSFVADNAVYHASVVPTEWVHR